jgi:Skp family chaperone for outer membrane proteins
MTPMKLLRVISIAVAFAAACSPALAQQQQQQPRPAQRPAQQQQTQPAPAQQAQPAQQPAAQPAPAALQLPTELPPVGTQFVILDSRLIMTQSTAALGLRQQAERQNTTLRGDMQKQEQDFKNEQSELGRQRGKLSAEQFDQRVRDIQKRMSDAQTKLQNRARNLDRAYDEANQKISQAMLQASVEVAEERKYMIILDRGQVVAAQSNLEITGEIMSRVNQRLTSVPLQLPAN